MEFKERLEYAMKRKGYKQIDLSHKTGLAPGTISNYVQGKYKAKDANVKKIAHVLDVNERWLSGEDVPIEVPDDYIYINYKGTIQDPEKDRHAAYFKLITNHELGHEELHIISKYRIADPAIKRAVKRILEVEDIDD